VAAGVPYHHVPVEPGGKQEAGAMLELLRSQAELLVLARYMRSSAATSCSAWHADDQHPPLLPAAFAGATLRRAHERGVKLIGATAH